MLNISKINNFPQTIISGNNMKKRTNQNSQVMSCPEDLKPVTSENVLAYYPSFSKKEKQTIPSILY